MSSEIILSVGLIVKNEEKRLAACLDGIKRVQEKIPTEIVIVDTGSTDNTVEIAKQYTDKVYDFAWIDDFAAARNFGLEKCTGKWFMFLDADEILDTDVTHLVDFLKNPEEYNSARLLLKNYTDKAYQMYTESRNLRLVNMGCKVAGMSPVFKGAIHEGLPTLEPCKQLMQVVHHYGYMAEGSMEAMREKHRRNMPALLKLYKDDDKNPRTLAHLFYSCEPEDKERYLTEWYSLLNLPYRDVYSLPVYVALIQTLLDGQCYEDALYYAEEYLKSYGEDTVTTLSVLALTVCALSECGQMQLSTEFFNDYDEMYNMLREDKIDIDALNTCVVFFGSAASDYIGLALLHVSDLMKLGEKKKALDCLSKLEGMVMPKMLADAAKQMKEELTKEQ